MARLPDIESFGARPTPRPSLRVPGPTGQETAQARATEALAGAMGEFGQVYDRVQDQNDKTRAEEAYNKLLERRAELTHGEQGFVQRKSGDAVNTDLFEDYNGQFDSAISDIGKDLNTRQQKYYRSRASIASRQYKEDMLRHVTKERDTYAKETFGATLDIETKNAAMRWNDSKAVDTSLVRIKGVIDQEADRLGWPARKTKMAKFEAGSNVYAGVIQQAINNRDPMMAREIFEKRKKQIDPSLYDDIERLIKNTDLTELVQNVADDAQLRGLSEFEALVEVRKKYSGEEEKELIAGIKGRYAETQAAAGEAGWNIFTEAEGSSQERLDQIPVDVWDAMSGQEKTRIKKFALAEAGGIPTGGGAYYKLRKMYSNNPLGFLRVDLNKEPLAGGDKKELIKLQTDESELGSAQTRDQIIKSTVAAMNFDPTEVDETGSKGDKVRAIYARITQEIQSESTAKGGRKLTLDETQAVADRLRIEVIRQRNLYPFGEFPWRLFGGDIEARAGAMEIEGIPTDMIDELAESVLEAGQPVTEENIRILYAHLQTPRLLRAP